jgi:hypothetical protein
MKARYITFVVCCGILTACATAKRTYGPDGRAAFAIECSGQALSWGKCYEKAGEICGGKGYDVIERNGDQSESVSATQYGVIGGTVVNRSMLISCKGS